ncbi:2-oxoglutarate and iron-dependent oxygenase domain-containing protein [Herbidospora sp. NBRC 101105]|uniref:isopenicillin N synthase family dioxygenase n=1 Tax=Herbidospora sp. NBRC 101105 TaxID=3032195 RepID=UPI0024A14F71|nr:2-oxoglutarate and iron-dependent oxygenase domain-containing protein [Herbidospora sp. NBRC 101105]GLX94633.1 iron/ascorbate oxidoreductase [Herbidospora sp. NBRC 101105]
MTTLPVIDVRPLLDGGPAERTAAEIEAACVDSGFFYVSGHGVPAGLIGELDDCARRFFALPEEAKLKIAMARGGRAWRGFFPVGGELTSGRPDLKEGLYFGAEREPDGRPLHGRNLFPEEIPEMRGVVLRYLAEVERVAQAVLGGVALSLGLPRDHFSAGSTADPTVLFRIFHYPPGVDDAWGVGEHTDYGLLTLLLQDANAGLQVRTSTGWVDAPPIPGTFVCNIGDMLDRLTGGHYRSTPHRVFNATGRDRLSFPFFFDPGWDSELPPLPPTAKGFRRWDGQDLRAFTGTYGDYLLGKVSKVFPELRDEVI